MARTKEKYSYTFEDQTVEWESRVYVLCTVTGKKYSYHHDYLAKKIKDKFCNNLQFFKDRYVSKEAKMAMEPVEKKDRQKTLRTIKKIDEVDDKKPYRYKLQLLLNYKNALKANNKAQAAHVAQQFVNRYEEDIINAKENDDLDDRLKKAFSIKSQ